MAQHPSLSRTPVAQGKQKTSTHGTLDSEVVAGRGHNTVAQAIKQSWSPLPPQSNSTDSTVQYDAFLSGTVAQHAYLPT